MRNTVNRLPCPIPFMSVGAVFAVLLFLTAIDVADADMVHMKNGRSMQGQVIEETDEYIILDLGGGTLTFDRDKVERIEKSGAEETAEQEESWKRRFITSPKYIPRGYEAIARHFDSLTETRDEAFRLFNTLKLEEENLDRLSYELESLERKLVEISRARKSLDSNYHTKKYNEAVTLHNNLVSRSTLVYEEFTRTRKKLERLQHEAPRKSNMYRKQLRALRAESESQRADADLGDSDVALFIDELFSRLDAFETDFNEQIPQQRIAGLHVVVDVTLNDQFAVPMIVDSGASFVVIPHKLAEKLGLELREDLLTSAELADGSVSEGYLVQLSSVSVGGSVARYIVGMVMKPTDKAMDEGLLGMTYLRNFNWHIDSVSGQLVIEEFIHGR